MICKQQSMVCLSLFHGSIVPNVMLYLLAPDFVAVQGNSIFARKQRKIAHFSKTTVVYILPCDCRLVLQIRILLLHNNNLSCYEFGSTEIQQGGRICSVCQRVHRVLGRSLYFKDKFQG